MSEKIDDIPHGITRIALIVEVSYEERIIVSNFIHE